MSASGLRISGTGQLSSPKPAFMGSGPPLRGDRDDGGSGIDDPNRMTPTRPHHSRRRAGAEMASRPAPRREEPYQRWQKHRHRDEEREQRYGDGRLDHAEVG